jgi:Alanyl-tRNA synthetase
MRTSFIGYEQLECTATVQALLKGNELVGSGGAGEEIDIILDTTPFYAESGGQAGDRGLFSGDAGVEAEVIDTVKVDEVIIHRTKILRGSITKGIRLYGRVNPDLRSATARNHTATHLLQSALRAILGGHVEQSGSAVSEEKLRFDFSHLSALPAQTLQSVEQKVNQCIWANTPVQTAVMNIDEAKACGALAFFGEKYGSTVRVLSIGDYSREFCGGTHVRATGEIGLFKIITEYSVAQGIRRIEAVTGAAALALVQEREQLIAQASELLKLRRPRCWTRSKKTFPR